MWPFILSRVRRTLMVVAVVLTVALVVAAILFARDRPRPTHTYTYQLYTLLFTPAAPWHPGQSLRLLWVPSVQSGPDAPPRSVTCHFRLYGPYATQGDAQADLWRAATQADLSTVAPQDAIPLAASAPPLVLSTARGPAPAPVIYVLSATVTPGYYVAVSSADWVGSTPWITEVAA
jgi:hypothetical protein